MSLSWEAAILEPLALAHSLLPEHIPFLMQPEHFVSQQATVPVQEAESLNPAVTPMDNSLFSQILIILPRTQRSSGITRINSSLSATPHLLANSTCQGK